MMGVSNHTAWMKCHANRVARQSRQEALFYAVCGLIAFGAVVTELSIWGVF